MGVLQNLREEAVGVLALLVLGVGFLDAGLDVVPGVPFWVVFVVGYAVVLPLVAIALGEDESEPRRGPVVDPDERDAETPLDRLKRRYADGEIDEAEFEHRLERLLETEDETAATEYVERTRTDRERELERE